MTTAATAANNHCYSYANQEMHRKEHPMTPVVGKEPKNRRPQHYVTRGSSFAILNDYHLLLSRLHDYYFYHC